MKHTIQDYERAIRRHRQNAFNEKNGDAHSRAIQKLKNSKVMQAVYAQNEEEHKRRISEAFLRMYA